MHCKIRHFTQTKNPYSTEFFNRIDPGETFIHEGGEDRSSARLCENVSG